MIALLLPVLLVPPTPPARPATAASAPASAPSAPPAQAASARSAPPAQATSATSTPSGYVDIDDSQATDRVKYPVKVDIDGDGKLDPITVEYSDYDGPCAKTVVLDVGGHRVAVWSGTGGVGHDGDAPSLASLAIEVVDLTPGVPGEHLLLRHDTGCWSDYHSWIEVAYGAWVVSIYGRRDGMVRQLWQAELHDSKVKMRRNGSWETDQIECVRSAVYKSTDWPDSWEGGHRAKVKRMGRMKRTTRRHTLGKAGIETRVIRTRTVKSKCGGSRFCPFVYVGDSPVRIGEILRNQVGRAAWRDDRLRLPPTTDDHLVVRLAEEKLDEITYLDGVWLEVDGQRRSPTGCGGAAWCRVDGRLHRMRTGDVLKLRFDGLRPGQRVVLGANGYYTLGEGRAPSLER